MEHLLFVRLTLEHLIEHLKTSVIEFHSLTLQLAILINSLLVYGDYVLHSYFPSSYFFTSLFL